MSADDAKDIMSSSMMSGSGESIVTTNSDNESWTILDEEDEMEISNPGTVIEAHDDSDIETLNQEANLESLNSDGIPVGEELSESGEQQYIWSNETLDNDEDDLEVIEEDLILDARTDGDALSGYPPEELVDHFSKITKGRTYLHQPNRALNLYLTATLVVVAALVLGVGVGHFKGWSERLELQEQYADIREERMDKLTESLVNCMTGEEGRGGDDQDLDDIVIRQLKEENERLKFELEVLRDANDDDLSSHEEMTAILRDRINDLLVANSDLEKEVVRLRYASPGDPNVQAKVSLNSMKHENDQLKLAIAKERYGPRQVPIFAKEQLNILQTENEELKTEVRKFRYGVHTLLDQDQDDLDQDDHDQDLDFNVTKPNFITLNRLQPVLPPVILLGGKVVSNAGDQDQDDEEAFVETLDDLDNQKFDLAKVGQVIDDFKKTAQDFMPDETRKSAQDLSLALKDKWAELGLMAEKQKVDKLAKTIVKALGKAKEIVAEEFAPDLNIWSGRLNRVQAKFQSKWEEVMEKFKAKECKERPKKKGSTSWSKKNMSKDHDQEHWVFKRAATREKSRKESAKSDWLFDRASARKRFHNLLEMNKHCEDEDGNCLKNRQETSKVNHGKATKKHHSRGETETLSKGQDFMFPKQEKVILNNYHKKVVKNKGFFDDDTYIRGHYGFQRPQNRGYDKQGQKSKKSEKKSFKQPKFFDDHIVHFMHNKVN